MRTIDSTVTRQFVDRTMTSSRPDTTLQRDAWLLVGVLGLVFAVLAFADMGLGIYPFAFGHPEWEFGTVSAILNGLAFPTIGLYLLLGSLVARGKRTAARVTALGMAAITVLLVFLGLLYVMAIPLALKSVSSNADVSLGMKKAIVKATILMVGYLGLFIFGAVRGWRSGRVN